MNESTQMPKKKEEEENNIPNLMNDGSKEPQEQTTIV